MKNFRLECGDGPNTYPPPAPIGEGRNRESETALAHIWIFSRCMLKHVEMGERCPDLVDSVNIETHAEEAGGQM